MESGSAYKMKGQQWLTFSNSMSVIVFLFAAFCALKFSGIIRAAAGRSAAVAIILYYHHDQNSFSCSSHAE